MKTGMLAAETAFKELAKSEESRSNLLSNYEDSWKKSSVWKDLWKVRNVKPSLKWGIIQETFTQVSICGCMISDLGF